MIRFLFYCCILTCFVACKNEKNGSQKQTEMPQSLSIAEKIAHANGFENWKRVSELHFTFNVDRDSSHFERSWIWKPNSNEVTMISGKDSISYNRTSVDSISMNADKAFVNDKYWLLAPFQLVWDKNATLSEAIREIAPISKTEMNKITITYPSDGGYTPGDAYDLFYDDAFMVKEWIYREGNFKEASMMTTWEAYEDFKGIKIAKSHKKPDANWTLHFTDIKVVD